MSELTYSNSVNQRAPAIVLITPGKATDVWLVHIRDEGVVDHCLLGILDEVTLFNLGSPNSRSRIGFGIRAGLSTGTTASSKCKRAATYCVSCYSRDKRVANVSMRVPRIEDCVDLFKSTILLLAVQGHLLARYHPEEQ